MLQAALQQNNVQLWYQPVTHLHGEPRDFFEVQLFIGSGGDELVPVADFMPAAQRAGIADKLDRVLVKHAIDTLATLHKRGRQSAFFISLSPMCFADGMLLRAIQQHIKTMGVSANKLYFQLDGPAFAAHREPALAFIREAKKIGAGVVVDGFGTGLSEQVRLAGSDVDFVKIDCSPGGEKDPSRIVAAAQALGRPTIASGVEQAEVFSVLFSSGVDYVQGDYLHPASPEPEHEFEDEQTLTSDGSSASIWQRAG